MARMPVDEVFTPQEGVLVSPVPRKRGSFKLNWLIVATTFPVWLILINWSFSAIEYHYDTKKIEQVLAAEREKTAQLERDLQYAINQTNELADRMVRDMNRMRLGQ